MGKKTKAEKETKTPASTTTPELPAVPTTTPELPAVPLSQEMKAKMEQQKAKKMEKKKGQKARKLAEGNDVTKSNVQKLKAKKGPLEAKVDALQEKISKKTRENSTVEAQQEE